ncbi:hypothetical protein ACFLSA_07150 [Bacteroidota bacterium]
MTINSLLTSEKIKDTDIALVEYYLTCKLIAVTWKGEVYSEQYRNTFEIILEYGKNHRVDIFMSDIRKQKIVAPEDRIWFEEYVVPEAIKLGLKRGAVVFDGNPFKKYYLNNISARTRRLNLPFRFFNMAEDAIKWLTE